MKILLVIILLCSKYCVGQQSPVKDGKAPVPTVFGNPLKLNSDQNSPGHWNLPSKEGQIRESFQQGPKNDGGRGIQEMARINVDRLQNDFSGKFSQYTSNGSLVYNMPPDYMPCLVPDPGLLEKMGTGKEHNGYKNEQMPNAIPRQQIIPKNGQHH
jgi:hypothetical protein